MALTSAEALSHHPTRALAAAAQAQTPLPSSSIPKYVTPLMTFAGQRVSATSFTTVMTEFQQDVLPPSVYPAAFAAGTWVWGYKVANKPANWPGFTVEAQRGHPTTVNYVTDLPWKATGSKVQPLLTVDQTIHWADPSKQMGALAPYAGRVLSVPHLHGAEVPSQSDGAPEAWSPRPDNVAPATRRCTRPRRTPPCPIPEHAAVEPA